MTRYADYGYYSSTYHGNMSEEEFNQKSIVATSKIKSNTFGRIDETDIPNVVKDCMCVLTDKINLLSKSTGKSHESVGKWSITYASTNTNEQSIISTINEMLSDYYASDGTPLIYRGC